MAQSVLAYAALFVLGAAIAFLGSVGRGAGILHRVGAIAGRKGRR